LWIAEFFSQQGVRATFKLVGEKARVLERRQRTDVIDALARHEIGYHSNTHREQPTPAVYESVLDWGSGGEEFNRRERPGFDDLTRRLAAIDRAYQTYLPEIATEELKDAGVQIISAAKAKTAKVEV
jgi:hypothetical protein